MTTVFTNGIFDILHEGHVRLLQFAKAHGDRLIVAINSDLSAKRLKGPTRPIFNEDHRKQLLQELRCVDEVVIFTNDTPESLIRVLRPDVLVKGPDAKLGAIPGADLVAKVICPDWPVVESTSLIIQKVLATCDRPLSLDCDIQIEGFPDVSMFELSIGFNNQPDGYRPVLYRGGKRIIQSWTMNIHHNQPEDKEGVSG